MTLARTGHGAVEKRREGERKEAEAARGRRAER
ncbi:uncharacterized protein CMC5_010530 [Chondromyces crocatus]|uniref:Uncharacterized protein n=1 Tax=Chondromyces crocatus TaxID=52 RepID=A0A0K1E8B0_CHOCO|nr:uncharacterized protein CMC5_010530 [Chondromyces crocatus]